jgi:HK97 family phage major capsid protein
MPDIQAITDSIKDVIRRREALENERSELHGRYLANGLSAGEQERMERLDRGLNRLAAEREELNLQWQAALQTGKRDGTITTNRGDNSDLFETGSVRGGPWADLPDEDAVIRRDLSTSEARSRALSAVELVPGASDATREAMTRALEEDDDGLGTLARWALISTDPDYVKAFGQVLAGNANYLTDAERVAMRRANSYAQRAMSLTDAAGGVLVPLQLDPAVTLTSDGAYGEVAGIARNVIATGDVWNGVSSAGITAEWLAEATEAADAAPSFAQPSISIHKSSAFVPISLEAAMDEENVAAEVGKLLADAARTLESEAFVTGTGSGQPFGIVTRISADTDDDLIITSTTTDTFGLVDVFALADAVPPRFRGKATWLMNPSIASSIRQFDSAGGSALWTQLQAGNPGEMLGSPVAYTAFMDGSVNASTENFILVCGDFDNYVVARRVPFTIEYIPHLFGSNQRPTGQRGWFGYSRVGADWVNQEGFRILNVT